MPTHAEVVVAAPDRYVLLAARVFDGAWKLRRLTTHFLEDAIRVVALFLVQLMLEESLVVKDFCLTWL